jgi:PKD repeat protein
MAENNPAVCIEQSTRTNRFLSATIWKNRSYRMTPGGQRINPVTNQLSWLKTSKMKTVIFTLLLTALSFGAFATQSKCTVKLRIQSPTGNIDDATMYFDQGINPLYDVHEDAQKVFTVVSNVPEIFSYTKDQVPCSINGCGALTVTQVVSIGVHPGYNGLYNITCPLLDNFSPSSIIQLEDRVLGVFVDLRQNFYQVDLDTSAPQQGRFFLHVSTPAVFSSTNSDCQNTGGRISIALDTSVVWSRCELLNSVGAIVAIDSNVTGNVLFTGLAAGDYQAVFIRNDYTATEDFHIDGNYVTASIGVPGPVIYTNTDVVFDAIATNASEFQWDFGDGTLINGVMHPDQTYLEPGVYTINLRCANNVGCSATAQVSITVVAATGINDVNSKAISINTVGKQINVNLNDVQNDNAHIQVYNLLGQSLYTVPFSSQKETIDLGQQPTGYYLVSVKNAGKTSTKRIFLAQ